MSKVFLLLLLVVQALPAWALAPNYEASFKSVSYNQAGQRAPAAASCAFSAGGDPPPAGSALSGSSFVMSGPPNVASSYVCNWHWKDGRTTQPSRSVVFECLHGGTLTGGSPAMCGNVPDGQGPSAPPPVTCTKGVRNSVRVSVTAPFPTAYAGCEVTTEEVVMCWGPAGETDRSKFVCDYIVENTGNPAAAGSTGAPPASPAPPANPERSPSPPLPGRQGGGCPKGTVQAGVGPDGIPMCVGTGSAPENPPPAPPKSTTSQTTTNPDGSTTVTTTTTTTNRDGSTTTVVDKVTSSSGGGTTTTQTSSTGNTPSGAPGTATPTPDKEQANFCKQNPHLSICRESSISGSCGQTSCIGDAIQCATLRAAAEMNCKQKADEEALKASPLHSLGQAAAGGNDPAASTLPTTKNAAIVNMTTIDQSGFIGGAGSAFKDVSFTVQGKTFAVPLNEWSGYLVGLRYALMVVASLVSFRMLSGVILRD